MFSFLAPPLLTERSTSTSRIAHGLRHRRDRDPLLLIPRHPRELAGGPRALGLVDPVAPRRDEVPPHMPRGRERLAPAQASRARPDADRKRCRDPRPHHVQASSVRASSRRALASPIATYSARSSATASIGTEPPGLQQNIGVNRARIGRGRRGNAPQTTHNDARLRARRLDDRQACRAGHARTQGPSPRRFSGSAIHVWIPDNSGPCARSALGERSLWTMPCPAVIRLTAPGSIVARLPIESRWSIAPANRYVTVARLMCGCGRTSIPSPTLSTAGPIWSKKMNGPTIVRGRDGSVRWTLKPPKSCVTGVIVCRIRSSLVTMKAPVPQESRSGRLENKARRASRVRPA